MGIRSVTQTDKINPIGYYIAKEIIRKLAKFYGDDLYISGAAHIRIYNRRHDLYYRDHLFAMDLPKESGNAWAEWDTGYGHATYEFNVNNPDFDPPGSHNLGCRSPRDLLCSKKRFFVVTILPQYFRRSLDSSISQSINS